MVNAVSNLIYLEKIQIRIDAATSWLVVRKVTTRLMNNDSFYHHRPLLSCKNCYRLQKFSIPLFMGRPSDFSHLIDGPLHDEASYFRIVEFNLPLATFLMPWRNSTNCKTRDHNIITSKAGIQLV